MLAPEPDEEDVSVENGKGSAVVVARELTRRYGEGDNAVDALRGVSVEIEPGKMTAVMGPSGSGKSTLMHILAGLDKPTSGDVTIAGTEITTLGDNDLTKLRREHIGFVFQFFNLLPMLTARENVLLPLTIAGEKPEDGVVRRPRPSASASPIGSRTGPAELSGGQQQRVAIARALVSKPTVVFADEPTGNLDSTTSHEILELMRASVDEYGQTMVMVTHDPRAAAMADRVLFLADGCIVNDIPRSSQHEILLAMEAARTTRDPLRRQGPRRPQAAHRADRDRDRARRRDGQRHVRAHRLDLERVRRDLLAAVREHRRGDHRQGRLRPRPERHHDRAAVRRVGARAR